MLEQAGHAQRWETVQQVQVRFAAAMLLAVLSASVSPAAEHGGALSGTVRDEHGVPQMGAVIELIGAGRGSVRTAVTGLDGRYLFNDLLDGTYRVRASASLLRPMSTRGLRVGAGMQAVVNLTLANIYSAGTLLPAERRTAGEPSDDWMWTMRSAASRPVLRLAGGVGAGSGTGQVEVGVSRHGLTPVAARFDVQSGSFGAGGAEQALAAGFRSADGADEVTGSALFGSHADGGAGPVAVRVSARRQSSAWSSTSTTVSFESDPAVRPAGGGAGWRAMRVASAETATFGDAAAIEAGSMLVSDLSQHGIPANRPFGRVRVFLPRSWTVEYALATDRSFQRAADAGTPTVLASRDEAGSSHESVTHIEHGRHQAVVLSHQSKTHSVALSLYRDTLDRTPILGSGSAKDLNGVLQGLVLLPGALVDSANGTFRAEGPGLSTAGCHAVVTQQLTPDAWVELRFANGAALELAEAGSAPEGSQHARIRAGHGVAAGIAAHSRVRRTGTAIRASYEWQPERMISPIDAFDATDAHAYLGFTLEQAVPVWLSPRGTVVHVSAGNVLRQGLRRVAGPNESVATLAQELPTLQAGIGFSF